MKAFFNSIKKKVTSLFGSDDEEQQEQQENQENQENQEKTSFNQNDCNLNTIIILIYLLVISKIRQKLQKVDQKILCSKELLEVRQYFKTKRRAVLHKDLKQYQQLYFQQFTLQEVTDYFQTSFTDQYDRLESNILELLMKNECERVLFSKSEFYDYLHYIENTQFASLYDLNTLDKPIIIQIVIDDAFEKTGIDDCDENRFISLFSNDQEVLQWVKQKNRFIEGLD